MPANEPIGAEEPGEEEEESGGRGDHAGACSFGKANERRKVGGDLSEDGRKDCDDKAHCDENLELASEKEGRGGRHDEHGDDNDGADRFKGGDGGDGDHGHDEVVHESGAEALSLGEAGIERGHREFFEKEGDDDDVEKKSGSDDKGGSGDFEDVVFSLEKRDEIERGGFKSTVEDTAGIEIDMIGCLTDEDEANGEEGGKDDAHSGPALDLAKAGNPLGKEGRENSGDGGAEEHPDVGAGAGYEESDGKAGKDGVTDGISHHAHAAKEEKGPWKCAGHRAQSSDEDDVKVVGGPVHEWVFLEAFCEAGKETEVCGVAVESDLDTSVEDEIFVDLVGKSAGIVGLVAVLGDDTNVFSIAAERAVDGVAEDRGEEELGLVIIAIVDEVELALQS